MQATFFCHLAESWGLLSCCMAVQLVNVQSNSEFASHMLNRDVWRDTTVKNIIQVGFVLYQVRHASITCRFSDCNSDHHVCLHTQGRLKILTLWHITPAHIYLLTFATITLYAFVEQHIAPTTQVQDGSESGNKVKSFYRLTDLPVILVVDPITGAALRTWVGAMEPSRSAPHPCLCIQICKQYL